MPNGFTDIALQEVRDGKKTIQDLERKAEFLAKRDYEQWKTMLEGIKAAIEILKQSA